MVWNGITGGQLLGVDVPHLDHLDGHRLGSVPQAHADLYASKDSTESLRMERSGILHGVRDCHVDYYIPACVPGKDECIHRFRNSWTMPYSFDVIAVHAHAHTAVINMTSSVGRTAGLMNENGGGAPTPEALCSILPTYGASGSLTELTRCRVGAPTIGNMEEKVTLRKGDTLHLEATYQQDARPHYGAMAYFVITGVRRPDLDRKKVVDRDARL